MNNLGSTEITVLNNLTDLKAPTLDLGSKLQEIISTIPSQATPVNAVAASKDLTFTGVVVDGETVTVNNPTLSGSDVYEFVTDAAKTLTAPTNIAVDIAASATKSSNTLTIPTQPTSGDTMAIGGKEYIFVPAGTANVDGEISVGTNLATAQAHIKAAINGTDGINTPNPKVTASDFAVNVCTLTALIGGVVGDAIATTETFTAVGNVFSGATLATGADCSAANAITALVAAVTASDTQGVGATDEAGDVVKLKADAGGVAGNDIEIGETLANATFAAGATKLSGGVNGTVAPEGALRVDASYLYVCIAANSISGANWRRISVGVVF